MYDDIDDYSPVVSDIEDQNDEETDPTIKSKRTPKDGVDKDDLLQQILNDQSIIKCELDNEMDADELEEHEEGKFISFFVVTKISIFT